MKNLLLLLILLLPLTKMQAQQTTLEAIANLAQEQKTVLAEALDAKHKAEAERKAALRESAEARREIAAQNERIQFLSNNRDEWEARAEWYRTEYDQLIKVDAKYRAMSGRVNWVASGCAFIVGILAGFLFFFYSGGIAATVPWLIAVVAGGAGIATFTTIQLIFRV